MRIIMPEIDADDFISAASDPDKATKFWNKHNPIPHELLKSGLYHILRNHLLTLLETCKIIDSQAYENIHKGHPFFFIGISSFRMADFSTAISFFDAALSEDLAIDDSEERPTVIFFKLKGSIPNNAAQKDTKLVQSTVNRAISKYNELISHNKNIDKLDIDKLRENFITYILENKQHTGLRTLLTTFFSFIVEWEFRDNNFELGIKKGTAEPIFMHLFRGCVLFESLFKQNPDPKPEHNNKKYLSDLINYYKNDMDLETQGDFLYEPSKLDTLEKLLTYLETSNETIEDTIKISYWLRNNLGHNIAWDTTLNRETFRKLYYSVLLSCLHVINYLWKSLK
jgi:hypothetical protein